MEEFFFSEITVLECVTLLDNEIIHRYFPTFLITAKTLVNFRKRQLALSLKVSVGYPESFFLQ